MERLQPELRAALRELVDLRRREMLAAHAERMNVLAPRRYSRPPVTHCKRGHELNEETRYMRTNGTSQCLICKRAARRGELIAA